jgi:hypothetical protein
MKRNKLIWIASRSTNFRWNKNDTCSKLLEITCIKRENKYKKIWFTKHTYYLFRLPFFRRWVLENFRESYVWMTLWPRFLLRNHYLYFEVHVTASDDLDAPALTFESHVLHFKTPFLARSNLLGLTLNLFGPTPFGP